MGLCEHPLRQQLVSEMHLRRWPSIVAPMLVVHQLRLIDSAGRAAEAEALGQGPVILAPDDNPRHRSGLYAGLPFVWEAHHEASGLTLFVPLEPGTRLPEVLARPEVGEAIAWMERFPGEVIRATRIMIVETDAQAQAMLDDLAFHNSHLVTCRVGSEGAVRVWSDFRIGPDGYGHLAVSAGAALPADLSRVVQQLQELGNYRNLALLGLPVAQAGWQALGRIETALQTLAAEVAGTQMTDDVLLERVSALSLDLMGVATAGSFRMNATAAYAALVEERLAELAPRAVPGYPSLTDFTQRRLMPAVRTCAAHVRREGELSQRASQFAALLRTRIETRIENQNGQLLRSMERSSSLQLRLQQLVEGLSVVALSYYGISLIGYMLKAGEALDPALDAPLWIGALVPVMLTTMWWGLHRMKHRVLGEHGE